VTALDPAAAELNRRCGTIRRQLAAERALRLAAGGALASAPLWAGWVWWRGPEEGFGLLLVAALLGLLASLHRVPSLSAVAAKGDALLCLDDRLLTALEHVADPSPMAALLRRDAVGRIAGIERIREGWPVRRLLLVGLLAGAALLVGQMAPNPRAAGSADSEVVAASGAQGEALEDRGPALPDQRGGGRDDDPSPAEHAEAGSPQPSTGPVEPEALGAEPTAVRAPGASGGGGGAGPGAGLSPAPPVDPRTAPRPDPAGERGRGELGLERGGLAAQRGPGGEGLRATEDLRAAGEAAAVLPALPERYRPVIMSYIRRSEGSQ